MSKLKVRKECFVPIKGIEKKEIIRDKKHKELVKEANKKIEEEYLRRAEIYENAKQYFNN